MSILLLEIKNICRLLIWCSVVLLVGCAPSPQTQSSTPLPETVSPVFAFSELVVGTNRMPLGLVRNQAPVNDPGAKIHLRFFNLDEDAARVLFESDATYYGRGLPAAIYVSYPTFDRAGNWGVEVQVQLTGQSQPSRAKLRLEVQASSNFPNVGEQAISVKTPTVKDVPDLSQLSSGPSPDPALYQISLDEALQSGRPTVLLFATPAFCPTATCGPSVQVVQQLQKTYGDRVNVIHVEVYRYPFDESFEQQTKLAEQAQTENRTLTEAEWRTVMSDAMVGWRLASEPWLYLIDVAGTIVARYEGGITIDEVEPAVKKLASGS